MLALLPELEGRFDLIYADPPFLTGKVYRARTGVGEDSRRPAEWRTGPGYSDSWAGGAGYLSMLEPRLRIMHRLLAPTGTLYLHLDWHVAAHARVLLDEIFGPERLLNEVVWIYHGPSPIRSAFKRKHDTLLVYTKSRRYTFNADSVRMPYDLSTFKTFASSLRAGFGRAPDLERGKVPEDWWYFPVVARLHKERTGYPTQKPEALLERVVLASSNPGDLVGDFFCGSGTLPVVARRAGRRWVACDEQQLAVNTSWRRLLLAAERAPFTVWRQVGAATLDRLAPALRLEKAGRSVTARVIRMGPAPLRDLASLEVDWDYDGELFISRAQAVRPVRGKSPVPYVRHDYPRPGKFVLAARVVDLAGREGIERLGLSLEGQLGRSSR
jgi:DNA modification methylase